ncbi:NUDIX hydrolase [Pseudomonas syringae]|jgi:8-oxo-dGTP diphosphatase|uniref:NUDIX hydrolase n=1 Tax=Pseudomonas syringae TaxID=317 RepID=UPI0006894762|nr:NUDIX hydrolase [Pseudomonas syringae]
MTTIGVFASIFNEAREVLCVQRNYAPYGWTTPGGRLEDGESPEQGVIREVYEETGYRVTVERLIGIYAAPFKSDLVISFECKIEKSEPWEPNEEIAARSFFALEDLPAPMRKNTYVRILDAAQGRVAVSRSFVLADH